MHGDGESSAASGQLSAGLRPWISLWLTIHFFALGVCLAANFVSSELERRILKVLAPYTVGLHQDYGGIPLEMTRGAEIDYPHALQIHHTDEADDAWQNVAPANQVLAMLDQRWHAFERWVALAAAEQNEELIYLLLQRCLDSSLRGDEAAVDRVRLVRRATLSYAADRARVAGELPVTDLEDRTLYEARVVELSGGRVKLLPVLESLRTSKSLPLKEETESSK
jgi:hypothetical protein